MLERLAALQLATSRIVLLLEHERGRSAIPPTMVEITLAEPTWQDEHLVCLLKERLGQLQLVAPVIALCLEPRHVEPMAPVSDTLFPEPGGTPEDLLRLLELLTARLGRDRVLVAAPRADHRPEAANRWVPAIGSKKAKHTNKLRLRRPSIALICTKNTEIEKIGRVLTF